MKRSVFIKIVGLLIIIVWIFLLAELIRKTGVRQKIANIGNISIKESPENYSEEWMDIFYKRHKVGYALTRVVKAGKGFEIKEEILLSLNLMGSSKKIRSLIDAHVDEQLFLKTFHFSLFSAPVTFELSGKIEGNRLYLSTNCKDWGEIIQLQSKPMISAGLKQFFRTSKLTIGNSYVLPLFDPMSMTTNPVAIKIAKKEDITIDDKIFKAFRCEMKYLGRSLVFWLDENGMSLKEEGFLGFTLVKSTPEKAQSDLDTAHNIDFYDISAITIRGKIEKPQTLSYMKVKFNQPPSFLPVDGSRQTVSGNTVTVKRESPPFKAPYAVPYKGDDPMLLKNVRPEMFIQSDDPDIVHLSEKIIGKTIDPFTATRRVIDWVFKNVEKTPVVSVPDAKKILMSKKGDCNEHATLLNALLRAAGIPSRIAIGLVYKDKGFYYHAWNEAYIDRWVSIDATLNQMPADATHITFITGGIDKQVLILGTIGSLEIEVLDYQ